MVFKKLLTKPELQKLEAGIVLQAYLPDSFEALKELLAFSTERTANGGAGIKVRIVKGANLAMEHVDSNWHGWELATYSTKADSDANYKRLIDLALNQNTISSLRVGIAGHNLFDLAFAHKLSIRRGVADRVEYEMLQGMAQHLSKQVKKSVGGLLLYTPVVRPSEFQVAVAYLTRRLEENGSPENFMSGVFDITSSREVFDRERLRFEKSITRIKEIASAPNRTQNRLKENPTAQDSFMNVSDTDPALPNNRDWIRAVLAKAKALENNLPTHESLLAQANIEALEVEEIVARAKASSSEWGRAPERRKKLILNAGVELAKARGELLQLMIAEGGKTFGEADSELSEAVDFANFYAHSIEEIKTAEQLDGVTFIPHKVVVVTPPWNFPVAIAAGGVLAALAAGASVIIKPAPQVVNCVMAMVETLWRSGIPRAVLQIALVPDNELGLQLVGHQDVDSVILTGAFETAQLFKNYRSRMKLFAETSGKNAIVISPFADLDLAAADLAKSAFGHAGQKCSAASLGILIGSVYSNKQFLKQLVDAVDSMKVGFGSQSDATVGPLIESPSPKLLRALTQLDKGESWLLEPKQLDNSGRLWRPGIKIGVQPGSFFHLTEVFGPVLGLIQAKDLNQALEIQNGTEFGLTAGLHSLNTSEITTWLENVDAGNLYVNRGITGAIVERQPFGGFKRSSVGLGLKAGGRNYLLQFGHFEDSEESTLESELQNLDRWQDSLSQVEPDKRDWINQAIRSDQYWRKSLYAPDHLDAGDLEVEGNYHRYLPDEHKIIIRVSQSATKADLVRLVVASSRGSSLSIDPGFQSTHGLSDEHLQLLVGKGWTRFKVETEQMFINSMVQIKPGTKLILVGAKEPLIESLQANPDLFVIESPITKSGRATLLAFYREQSISITQHRFGSLQSELINILN